MTNREELLRRADEHHRQNWHPYGWSDSTQLIMDLAAALRNEGAGPEREARDAAGVGGERNGRKESVDARAAAPAAPEATKALRYGLGMLASAVKCGEDWTKAHQLALDTALEIVRRMEAAPEVPLPISADMAELMEKLGFQYLAEHAPERLTAEGRARASGWRGIASAPIGAHRRSHQKDAALVPGDQFNAEGGDLVTDEAVQSCFGWFVTGWQAALKAVRRE